MLRERIERPSLLLHNNALTTKLSELYLYFYLNILFGEKENRTLTFVMQTQMTTIIRFPLFFILKLFI